jgi:DNA-binding MarR family transcriptional regulator
VSTKPGYAEPVAEIQWLSADEQRAWSAYRRMRTLLDLQLTRDLGADSGLSEPDYDVLSTLSEAAGGRWRASELATRLLWSSSRLAHHVGRMERRGLVGRRASADDRRGAVIELTDAGWDTLRAAAPRHVASVRRHLVDLLTPMELETLGGIARKVVDHLGGDVPPEP